MKRYRYRKVTPEILEKMKELREEGMIYKEIGKRFDTDASTVLYHLSTREKMMSIKRSNKSANKMTKKQKQEKSKQAYPYIKEYNKERYNNDEEFRKRFVGYVCKSQKKIRDKRRENGLCTGCSRKREEKRFIECEICRRKRRESDFRKGNVKNPRK